MQLHEQVNKTIEDSLKSLNKSEVTRVFKKSNMPPYTLKKSNSKSDLGAQILLNSLKRSTTAPFPAFPTPVTFTIFIYVNNYVPT